MAIRYQWVRFSAVPVDDEHALSSGEWVLAQIDDAYPNGGVLVFGVDHSLRQDDICEFGPDVPKFDGTQ